MPVAAIASTGFALARRFKLGQKVGSVLRKGFGLLKDQASKAKFTATEKGFSLSAPGLRAQGGQAAQGVAGQAAYAAPGTASYLPYLIGGALLLMFLKK